jgi:hypothetical protein
LESSLIRVFFSKDSVSVTDIELLVMKLPVLWSGCKNSGVFQVTKRVKVKQSRYRPGVAQRVPGS